MKMRLKIEKGETKMKTLLTLTMTLATLNLFAAVGETEDKMPSYGVDHSHTRVGTNATICDARRSAEENINTRSTASVDEGGVLN